MRFGTVVSRQRRAGRASLRSGAARVDRRARHHARAGASAMRRRPGRPLPPTGSIPPTEGGLLGYVRGPHRTGAGAGRRRAAGGHRQRHRRPEPVGIAVRRAGRPRRAPSPMPLRRDALAAAAEFVTGAWKPTRSRQPVWWRPWANSKCVPARATSSRAGVSGSLDVRSPDDAQRRASLRANLRATGRRSIAARRDLALDWTVVQEHAATPCDPALRARLAEAVPLPVSPCANCPAARATTPSRSPRGCPWRCSSCAAGTA